MSWEAVLRAAAVVAAVAVLASPHHERIIAAARKAGEAFYANSGSLSRVAAALLLVAAVWGKVSLPSFVVDLPWARAVAVPEPSRPLRLLVEPVRVALDRASPEARAAWKEIWWKAAMVVESESAGTDQIFKDVPALRVLTVTALEIGWRRLAGVPPGSLPGLRDGVEAALASAVGKDAKSLTDEMRASYVEMARALAWAGQR